MNSHHGARRRAVAIIGTLATGAALALTSTQPSVAESASAPGSSARAAAISSTSFYATGMARTSSGKKLRVSLSAYKSTSASFSISLSAPGEYHSWSFRAPRSAVKINSKGAGVVKLTSTQTGGLGKVKLRLKPDGKFKAAKCGGKVYSKSRNVKLSGPFFFNTKTKAWGKVGRKTGSFSFKDTRRVSFSYNVDCPDPEYQNPCFTSLSWSAYKSSASSFVSISGSKSGSTTRVSASRSVALKPNGAYRYDSVSKKAKAPVLTVAPDDNAKIKVYGTGGSATGSSSFPSTPSTSACDNGTQHRVTWFGTFTNGSPSLVVKAQVFGNFKLGNTASISFGRSWRTD
ncbi:hypothetical protein ncot_08485 [Nocardioides sp. JQ2195]|uniref:hypothetical protein n=1 Tax=Nocardioides sp. JQ2195 TaxID=2592334 RepID=UPI00143E2909|nr:hypothetical protein [Nocardioides sp. JQ2195]QIX26639.1 hypothetical protein ncot_08485 [Nocardioides sp. JQ2195]